MVRINCAVQPDASVLQQNYSSNGRVNFWGRMLGHLSSAIKWHQDNATIASPVN